MHPATLAAPALAVSLALAACGGGVEVLSASPVRVDAQTAAREITAYRARHGLGPVRVEPRLMRAAEAQALAMASRNRVSHSVAGRLPTRIAAAGYEWGTAAENVGAGYSTLAAAMAGWIASPGHERNLRSAQVTHIGIAAADAPGSSYGRYWALILAGPRPARAGTAFGG